MTITAAERAQLVAREAKYTARAEAIAVKAAAFAAKGDQAKVARCAAKTEQVKALLNGIAAKLAEPVEG